MLVFLFCWNEFLFALILTSQDALTFLPLLLRFVLPQGPLYGQIFAGATLFLIPPIIALLFIRGAPVGGLRRDAEQVRGCALGFG